jgi:hypothetical protein
VSVCRTRRNPRRLRVRLATWRGGRRTSRRGSVPITVADRREADRCGVVSRARLLLRLPRSYIRRSNTTNKSAASSLDFRSRGAAHRSRQPLAPLGKAARRLVPGIPRPIPPPPTDAGSSKTHSRPRACWQRGPADGRRSAVARNPLTPQHESVPA